MLGREVGLGGPFRKARRGSRLGSGEGQSEWSVSCLGEALVASAMSLWFLQVSLQFLSAGVTFAVVCQSNRLNTQRPLP